MNEVMFGNITVLHYILLATMLFSIGLCGLIINRKNIITMLMSIEIMLLSCNINFVTFSKYLGSYDGQVFTIFVLAVAAAEAAIGLAILVCYFRNKGEIDAQNINSMGG